MGTYPSVRRYKSMQFTYFEQHKEKNAPPHDSEAETHPNINGIAFIKTKVFTQRSSFCLKLYRWKFIL